MSDRYIPGVPCWIDTTQPDPDAAAAFYGGLFGWALEDAMPPGSPGRYLMARLPGGEVGAISSQQEGASPAATWNTYVWVLDADATAAQVSAAGGAVISAPFDVPGAGRMAVLADPAGAAFCVWQAGEHRGATVVNEPGSLNFNNLHTRDVDGAASFYGAVFGWDLIDIGAGLAWALPGYGDFLEQLRPGTLENMAQLGAPERFEDVVASLVPIGDADGDTAAHWSVTFGVADADATAARAAELGGSVVAPPADAPWVRMAVIADPAGATFTASQFVPENGDAASGGR